MASDTIPTVSILIPCFNKQPYVVEAVESALAQGEMCEVIVVDDGSTDGSLEEIRRFNGAILWEAQPNRGGSAARNRALELASGTYVQFLDADDVLPAGKIAAQLAALQDAPADAVAFCPWAVLHDSGRIGPLDRRPYWRNFGRGSDLLVELWYLGGFFPLHVWLTPRALIGRVGGWNEALTGDDDGDFFGRILVAASELRFCGETCGLYRDPPAGSVSRNKSLQAALSFWEAFENVSQILLSKRSDKAARLACLARARQTAYAWRSVPEVLARAVNWERQQSLFALSPSLPPVTRYMVGLLGLKRGLALRFLLERVVPNSLSVQPN